MAHGNSSRTGMGAGTTTGFSTASLMDAPQGNRAPTNVGWNTKAGLASGIEDPRLQWRDRAGLAPASALRIGRIVRANVRVLKARASRARPFRTLRPST